MQNKGFVKVFAVLLTLVCVFYLSFSFVTRHYTNKAKEIANGDTKVEQDYLDSLSNEKVWLGNYTLKQCREMEISLGLDLKGGMNVILEVSIPDVIKALADNKPDENFNQALATAAKQATNSQDDVITLFIKEYHRIAPDAKLSELFATQQLKDKVNQKSSDAEVEKVLRSEVKAAVENSYNVLRTRIDRFGVVQPNIQSLEDRMGRIMVELPGIKEPERVRKLLQGSANLEFWETYTAKELLPVMQSVDSKLRDVLVTTASTTTDSTEVIATEEVVAEATPAKAISAADSIAAALKGNQQEASINMEQIKKEHPLMAILQLNSSGQGPIIGYANYKDTAEINKYLAMREVIAELPKDLRLKWGVAPADFDKKGQTFELYAIKSTERNGKAPLEGDVVTDAKDDFDQHGKPSVSMSMNTDGARRWAQLTKQNIGRSIAIVLDNYVYSAPNVSTEITGGNSIITGNFSPEQSKDLANVLKSGKMPAPAHIVQEDIVGPSLGQESINAGIFSFVVALILLMIYMCAMYGFIPGMIANGALILNFFFTLGILSSFQAALTMSGIAGMVLALGMAVDANVLIYERTKEELRSGKGVKKALADGYSNAFSAIFDSNLTSIITGIILFNFGTGPIRGFATTLIIGILCSFFTAVFMTRLVYEHYMNKDKLLNLTFTSGISKNLLVNTHFDFMKGNKRSFMITGIIILVCIASFAIRGLSQSIDFTGGRNYKVQFEQAIEPEQVRELIASKFGDANVSVIAIGTDKKTVRISTNYRIEEEGNNVDSEIEAYLYETLKPLLTQNISLATFIDRDNHTGGSIISSQKVGPSIADDIKTSAVWSVVLALIAIGLYILLRFRNIAYSVGSVVALTSDTIMIIGAYSLLWGFVPFSLEIDQTFIGAILTAIGYSINDKVVIFDRVREFFGLYPKRNKRQLFNDSLNTTLARTINTSLSTLIVLLCIFILGGDSIRSFAFAMILGVIIGTLSSLFIASPIAYTMLSKKKETAETTAIEAE
ncbi:MULTISPECIES: protein translocase subunit SecDF [Bacteroidaceae]|jgi:SecD/SecF fusion protein|uniref:protein translocase subunit SecDF n=1 Tax=Bacteroidaceae TaxID=815 RepID=UPI00033643F4|nr:MULTISPECIES: protein translocase subunit SecDF [Bacteroides]MBT9917020.1 protein translocase subunit SecDF [Bacteroides salyersiae]RHF04962.1 protein translocase subunit SecDF [Bacteroides salyersiae]UYU45372.1 protein translocase subunit SecDF [Bacteroides salyersiae]WMS10713.1 protein translocase subunit SecDF [Bacteroides salyersiae]CCY52777.1 protein-export membrane protein SecD [Bacteroides sp. CAG:189]